MNRQRIIIAAGGTGGHMFPAKAFAEEVIKRGDEVYLITDPRGKKYTEGFPSSENLILPVTNSTEGGIMGKVNGALTLLKSLGLVSKFYKNISPDAIVGFGGYPTFPALQEAKAPIIIHEQNAVLGRVNKFFQNKAKKLCSGFERLDGLKNTQKHVIIGNPVRKELVAARELPYPDIQKDGTIRILITGGSQGATVLGRAVPLAIANLDENTRHRLYISHQVREEQCEGVREIYADAGVEAEVWPFFKDMAGRLQKSHLIIGRSGASTVSETAVVGRAAILVPLPSAMNDHQTINAEAAKASGGADVIKESELSVDWLNTILKQRLENIDALKSRAEKIKIIGKPDAAAKLCDVVYEIIEGKNA